MLSRRNMTLLLAVAVALIAPALAVADGAPLGVGAILIDSPTRPFLRTQPDGDLGSGLQAESLPALLAALLGVPRASPVSSEVASQVDKLALPSVFHKPAAVVTLNIAGAGADSGGDLLEWGFPGSLHKVSASSDELLQGLDSMFSTGSNSVEHLPLDVSAVQGCDAECVEESIARMASYIDGQYTGTHECMNGTLQLPATGSKSPVVLQMSNSAHRVYAMEMAHLHKTVSDLVSGQHGQAAVSNGRAPQYMDCTMVGLQMLRDVHGRSSDEYQAAFESLASLSSRSMQQISKYHGDLMVAQVNLLGDVGVEDRTHSNTDAMLEWRRNAQPMRARFLQEVDQAPAVNDSDGTNWSKGALLWVTFWILLWFTWLCIYSLCTMPFKQDTLLYAKGKPE